jgi:hypothetical protein
MRPHDPENTKRPTKYVGGAGKFNKRGAKSHKSKEKK